MIRTMEADPCADELRHLSAPLKRAITAGFQAFSGHLLGTVVKLAADLRLMDINLKKIHERLDVQVMFLLVDNVLAV